MKKSRLGQNFLFDPSIARKIVDSAQLSGNDKAVEIGPGHGIMTRYIAEKAGELIAIELDRKLFLELKDKFNGVSNLILINEDAMEFDYGRLGPFKVIANIPYYITTPIIFKLIEDDNRLTSMTLTIQKEVAERIVAGPGSKSYGVLSLMVQYYGDVSMLFTIPAGAFRPRPKVDSAVIRIDRYEVPPVELTDPELFRTIIKSSFANRRKMLSNSLRNIQPDIRTILEDAGIDPSRRPETLSMNEFASLSNTLYEKKSETEDHAHRK